jgi:aryl-alcohol dehydrogenase-like predicted oxidoreductase
MKQHRLGKTGLVVTEIGLGTMTFGSMADETTSHAIMDCAIDHGINFFDTAEMYPVPPNPKWAGQTEEVVGKWLAGRSRDSIILASKVTGPGGGWFLGPVRSGNSGLDRHNITRAIEGSLTRLGTDYLDLYQTHWPDPDLPQDETMEALDRAVESGKVRYLGCSNENAYGLMKNLWTSADQGLARYETIQNNFSLLNRRFEDELATICRREKVSLLAYSPLAGGVLTGKYQGGAWPESSRFTDYRKDPARGEHMTRRFVNEKTLASVEAFSELAKTCDVSITTFAVAWSLTRDFLGSSLVGATTVAQLEESIAAANVTLSADVLAACDKISKDIMYPMG